LNADGNEGAFEAGGAAGNEAAAGIGGTDAIRRDLSTRLGTSLGTLRSLYVLNGAAHLALRLLLMAVILFLIDYSLALPQEVRIVLGVLALGYAAFSVYRLFVFPLTRTISEEDMALAVEERFPLLDGRLISAVQLATAGGRGLVNVSPSLARAALKQAHGTVSAESWDGLFETFRIKRAALAAAALLVLAAGFGAWQPGLAGVGFSRMLGGAIEWPRKTTLLLFIEAEGAQFKLLGAADPRGAQSVVVAEGASLPVRIGVEGRDPGDVEIVQQREDAGGLSGGGTYVSTAVRRGKGEFTARVRDIRAPMTIRARGGDDDGRGRDVSVTVVPVPAVASTRAVYVYPEYLGMESAVRESAEIEAPEGTRVDLEFFLTSPAKRAMMRIDAHGAGAEAAGEIELAPEGGAAPVLRHSLFVTGTGTYRIELWNERNFENLDVPVHSIICQSDAAPRIKQLYPRRKEFDVAAGAVIPFLVVAEDDYGVSRMGIRYKVAGSGAEEALDFSGLDINVPFGGTRIVSRHVMDLSARRFPFEEGSRRLAARDSVIYSLFADDTQPAGRDGRAMTGTFVVDVVSQGEKIRLLTERQIRLRREIKALLAVQEEKREKVAATISDVESGGDEALREQALLSHEMGQNQITSRFRSATREFADLFEEYLFNRIDGSTGAAALLERVLQIRKTAAVAEVFEPVLYRPLAGELAAGAFGEMDVMSRLLRMMALSLLVSHDLSPAAAESLAAAVIAVEKDEKVARLREALDGQTRIIETLNVLLERIAEWEDFQDLLQMMRDLVDDQDRLNSRTREWIRK